jgi:hypothetical protein
VLTGTLGDDAFRDRKDLERLTAVKREVDPQSVIPTNRCISGQSAEDCLLSANIKLLASCQWRLIAWSPSGSRTGAMSFWMPGV